MPRLLRIVLYSLVLSFASAAVAQQLKSGVDYRPIVQQPVEDPGRIEVIDFFFYACPYCNQLTPLLERWLERKPADVVFRHVPVVRHDSWVPLAKIWFALEAMGAQRLHSAVYRSYHVDDLAINQEKVIAEWAEKHGLDRDRFMEIYRSDAVREKVARARKMTFDYKIEGTPSLVVDGKYLTSPDMAGSVEGVIPMLDRLVALARQQRAEKTNK